MFKLLHLFIEYSTANDADMDRFIPEIGIEGFGTTEYRLLTSKEGATQFAELWGYDFFQKSQLIELTANCVMIYLSEGNRNENVGFKAKLLKGSSVFLLDEFDCTKVEAITNVDMDITIQKPRGCLKIRFLSNKIRDVIRTGSHVANRDLTYIYNGRESPVTYHPRDQNVRLGTEGYFMGHSSLRAEFDNSIPLENPHSQEEDAILKKEGEVSIQSVKCWKNEPFRIVQAPLQPVTVVIDKIYKKNQQKSESHPNQNNGRIPNKLCHSNIWCDNGTHLEVMAGETIIFKGMSPYRDGFLCLLEEGTRVKSPASGLESTKIFTLAKDYMCTADDSWYNCDVEWKIDESLILPAGVKNTKFSKFDTVTESRYRSTSGEQMKLLQNGYHKPSLDEINVEMLPVGDAGDFIIGQNKKGNHLVIPTPFETNIRPKHKNIWKECKIKIVSNRLGLQQTPMVTVLQQVDEKGPCPIPEIYKPRKSPKFTWKRIKNCFNRSQVGYFFFSRENTSDYTRLIEDSKPDDLD